MDLGVDVDVMQESSFDLNRIHLGNAGFVWNCMRIGWECFDIGDL